MHRVVPAMIVLFLLTLFGVAAQIAMQSYDKVVPDALTEMDMVSRLRPRISRRLAPRRAGRPRRHNPRRRLGRFRPRPHLAVTDPDGQIIAAFAARRFPRRLALSARLGASQPLTVFAEKAGPMRIALPNGDRSARHGAQSRRALRTTAIIQPIESALSEWRSAAWRSGTC